MVADLDLALSGPGGSAEFVGVEVDLGTAIEASEEASLHALTLYIPNKDRYGNEFGTQRLWVLRAAELLAELGGGVTIMPPTEGGWLNEQRGTIIWEHPVQLYSYVRPDDFLTRLDDLRRFLHDLGRETDQGEVAIELDGLFYRITSFDEPTEVRRGKADQGHE